MRHHIKTLKLDLQAFAEGAAGVSGSDAGIQTGVAGGQQAAAVPAAGVQGAVATPNLEAEFEALIRGKYKDAYKAKMNNTVRSRVQGLTEDSDRYKALAPVLELLGSKYGIKDTTDAKAVLKALEEDDSFFEEEALRRNLTVQQLKEVRAMERENADLRRQMQEQQKRESADRLYASWLQQEQQTRQIYPGFSLKAELENPKFTALLKSNVDVRTAYEVVHKDEIVRGAMQFTAQQVEQQVANKIASGSARPAENGNASQGAATVRPDVSKMTKKDRAEIIRRVQRGEKISF